MYSPHDVLITGLGVVSPIGIGQDAFWRSLCEGASGVRRLGAFDTTGTEVRIGAEVRDFDPKQYVTPRKSLKVMSRDIQLGFTAADLACRDAGLSDDNVDPERKGVVFGADFVQCLPEDMAGAFRRCLDAGDFRFDRWGPAAMREIFPLWMLKQLPNMAACHIAIAQDARGPNNSHVLGEVSCLLAVAEGARLIERDMADVVICGGVGSRINPTIWVRSHLAEVSRRFDGPERASRPFDADRDGFVNGEGAAAFILERRDHAQKRGATPYARLAGFANTFQPKPNGKPLAVDAIGRAIAGALSAARMAPADLGHINAHGLSTRADDRREASAIFAAAGRTPVTALKSYFGHLGAGGGAVELAGAVLSLRHKLVPPTLNYSRCDPDCPVNVIHGAPLAAAGAVLKLSHTPNGQSAAAIIAAE